METEISIGSFKKVGPTIELVATPYFETSILKKLFFDINEKIFSEFNTEIKDSPAINLSKYQFTKLIDIPSIINDAKGDKIYCEVDLAHISQICQRHILGGEKLLKKLRKMPVGTFGGDCGDVNAFLVRDKKGELRPVYIYQEKKKWWEMHILKSDRELSKPNCVFLLP